MRIGYVHSTYLEYRSFLFVKNKNVEFVRVPDLCKLLMHIIYKTVGKILPSIQNVYSGVTPYKCEVLHLFNGVNFSSRPWVTSFETKVPRLGGMTKYLEDIAVNRLADDSCRKLIALSDNAASIQKTYIENNYPDLAGKIISKLVVIHPQQEIIDRDISDKINPKEKLIFTFVGRQFFRKGGLEILNVFGKICDEYSYCELNIVSKLEPDVYATNTGEGDVKKVKEILRQPLKNIIYHYSLSSKEVIKLMMTSHVALLPTHADTYGFSVLEAQACGTPVITTDVRALGEINNNECGWVIKIPKDDSGNELTRSRKAREALSKTIQEGLLFYVMDIVKNPGQIKNKARKALDRVHEYHNPEKIGLEVVEIYNEILGAN